jgi:hypothetical protein
VSWGHNRVISPAALIRLPPNAAIAACGAYQDWTIWAVSQWAQAINRHRDLKIVACDQASADAARIQVNYVAVNDTFAWAYMDTRVIEVHTGAVQNNAAFGSLMLHEVGHLWGVCDQHSMIVATSQGMPSWNYFCDPNYRSPQPDPNAVMGLAVGRQKLTWDDKEAIRRLATRPEIPANAAWQQWLEAPSRDADRDGVRNDQDVCPGSVPSLYSGVFEGVAAVDARGCNAGQVSEQSGKYVAPFDARQIQILRSNRDLVERLTELKIPVLLVLTNGACEGPCAEVMTRAKAYAAESDGSYAVATFDAREIPQYAASLRATAPGAPSDPGVFAMMTQWDGEPRRVARSFSESAGAARFESARVAVEKIRQ